MIEVTYPDGRPDVDALKSTLQNLGIEGYSVRPSGDTEYIIRAQEVSDQARASLGEALSVNGEYSVNIAQLTEIGPTIGAELTQKAFIALGLILFAIVLFVTFAFRGVSKPVSSWVYGLIALVALAHDVIVPVGVFAVLGHFLGAQADALFVTAVLTVLGFSVHDTIVVFDRVRENLRKAKNSHSHTNFAMIAGKSLNQTFVRSINTSIVVVISLLALFFLGPVSTQDFALMLLVGVIAGTYSSIALATPLLVTVAKKFAK